MLVSFDLQNKGVHKILNMYCLPAIHIQAGNTEPASGEITNSTLISYWSYYEKLISSSSEMMLVTCLHSYKAENIGLICITAERKSLLNVLI